MTAISQREITRSNDSLATLAKWSAVIALTALTLGLAQRAAAQEMEPEPVSGDDETALEPVPPPEPSDDYDNDEVGGVLAAGGGVSEFSRDAARDFVDTGGAWELRGIFGTRSVLGLEAAYIGAAYDISTPGDSTTLLSNGAELSARLNLLRNGMGDQRAGLQPYALAGGAWKNYQLSGDLATADVLDDDNLFEIPLGGGLAYFFEEGLMLDARFTYRFAFEDELIQPVGEDEAAMDNWAATARIGAEF